MTARRVTRALGQRHSTSRRGIATPTVVVLGVAAAGLAWTGACMHRPPAGADDGPPAPRDTGASARAATAPSGARPPAPATATPGEVAALAGSPDPAPTAEAAWNPWGALGAGTVHCGKEHCATGTEICTREGCLGRSQLTEDETFQFQWWAACDDGDDCGADRYCCEQFGDSSVSPARRICQSEPCAGDSACVTATDCGAEMQCVHDTLRGSPVEIGWCTERRRQVSCGHARCTAPSHCEWRPGKGPRCSRKPPEPGSEVWSLGCTGPRDCAAGRSCCLSQVGHGSWCANRCDPGRSHVPLCGEDGDCPAVDDRAGRCVASDGPRFVRWCR